MLDDSRVAASMRPPAETAIEAQEEAIDAQKQATEAQQHALAVQSAEAGVPPPLTCDDRLKAASEAVRLAEEKLIEHSLK